MHKCAYCNGATLLFCKELGLAYGGMDSHVTAKILD